MYVRERMLSACMVLISCCFSCFTDKLLGLSGVSCSNCRVVRSSLFLSCWLAGWRWSGVPLWGCSVWGFCGSRFEVDSPLFCYQLWCLVNRLQRYVLLSNSAKVLQDFFEKNSLLENFSLNKKTLRAVNQARSVSKGKTFYFKQLFFFIKKLMFG